MKNIILFVKQKTTRKSGCWWKTQDFEPDHIKTHTKSVVRFLFALNYYPNSSFFLALNSWFIYFIGEVITHIK